MSAYKMSESEAVELLKEWGEELEVDIESKEFEEAIKELKIPVRKENLTFARNEEGYEFRYVLFDPIKKKDETKIAGITLKPTSMEEKRVVQNYKDSQRIDQALAMIAASTGLEIGLASRIKDKDITRINAIITVFFV